MTSYHAIDVLIRPKNRFTLKSNRANAHSVIPTIVLLIWLIFAFICFYLEQRSHASKVEVHTQYSVERESQLNVKTNMNNF